jgi:hypothetical protein
MTAKYVVRVINLTSGSGVPALPAVVPVVHRVVAVVQVERGRGA